MKPLIFLKNNAVSNSIDAYVPTITPGHPIGARSIPVGTRLCLQSIVCYTFATADSGKGCSGIARRFLMIAEQGQVCDHYITYLPLFVCR